MLPGKFKRKVRTLIVGGTGYIGGRLAEYLYQNGYSVFVGAKNSESVAERFPNFFFPLLNWNSKGDLVNMCFQMDAVVNAMGLDAKSCALDPSAAQLVNGHYSKMLAEAATEAGVKKQIYLSTAHVYADPLIGDIDEKYIPRNKHPYATSKLFAESALLRACAKTAGQMVILRLSNVVGPPVSKNVNCWSLLVNDLCKQAIQRKTITLSSNKPVQRDFVSMSEVCRVIKHCLEMKPLNPNGKIFNVGSGISVDNHTMALKISERFYKKFRVYPRVQYDFTEPSDGAFTFLIKEIQRTGLTLSSDLNQEIDQLLEFCQNEFKDEG